jgi:hypothetical protein
MCQGRARHGLNATEKQFLEQEGVSGLALNKHCVDGKYLTSFEEQRLFAPATPMVENSATHVQKIAMLRRVIQ